MIASFSRVCLVCRLKAVLSQCAPNTEAIAAALAHSGLPCTLPGLTKLISKFNKSDQWRRDLAVFHALPAVGLSADATVANAALGSCDRGTAADSAWSIFYLMCERNLEADAISYKALISALCKGGQWQRGVVVRSPPAANHSLQPECLLHVQIALCFFFVVGRSRAYMHPVLTLGSTTHFSSSHKVSFEGPPPQHLATPQDICSRNRVAIGVCKWPSP